MYLWDERHIFLRLSLLYFVSLLHQKEKKKRKYFTNAYPGLG